MTIHTPNGPAPEPEPMTATVPELILTAPDEATLRSLTGVAMAVAEEAQLYRTMCEPWQLRIVKKPDVPDAAWRKALRLILEVY